MPRPRRRTRSRILSASGGEGAGDEWMLTYMDTVTLLVVLFVMLLSFASLDLEKYEAFTRGMDLQKYGGSVMLGTLKRPGPGPIHVERATAPPPTAETHADIEALGKRFAESPLPAGVSMKMRENSVAFEIDERVLFPSAQAELTPHGVEVVGRLAELFADERLALDVEGHTDDVPIATERFPSNWELSAARAASVARALTAADVAAEKVRIVGYAATQPIADNDTREGRARNRRVSLVVRVPNGG